MANQKRKFYAIHLPVKYRGVYHDVWDNVVHMAQARPSKQKAFRAREEADFYAHNGRVRTAAEEEELSRSSTTQTGASSMNNKGNDGIKLEELGAEGCIGRYYAVAKGKRPGVYDSWDEAKEQVNGFGGNDYLGFDDRAGAFRYLQASGIPDSEIRLFKKAFKPLPNFTPRPNISFNDEFKRFKGSQNWTSAESRQAKIEAIQGEIISHYLDEGLLPDQEDDNGTINLNDDQTLKIYQAMLRSAEGKRVYDNMDDCLLELNNRPFVNIMDFVNTFRTGERVRTFNDWYEFVCYTKESNRIDVEYAKENKFLSPLLQHLERGPGAFDPRRHRKVSVEKRPERMRERERNEPRIKREILSAFPEEPSFSPAVSDFSPSPSRSLTPTAELLPELDISSPVSDASVVHSSSPSPISDPVTPVSDHGASASHQPHIKLEQSSPVMFKAPAPPSKLVQEALPVSTVMPGVQTHAAAKRARNDEAVKSSAKQSGSQPTKRRKMQTKTVSHGTDIRSFFQSA